MLVAACCALIVLAVAAGTAMAKTGAGDACRAAAGAVKYDKMLAPPAALEQEIAAYREGWRQACAEPGSVSFDELFTRARRIEKAFEKIVGREARNDAEADRIDAALRDAYPRFIPAFEGSFWNFAFFRPDLAEFRAQARKLGDAEDRVFFDGFTRLRGDGKLRPWYEQTWDYGGCVRMGQYDWTGTLDQIDRLRARVKGREYRAMLARFEDALKRYWEDLADSGEAVPLCICERKLKDSVVPELRKILRRTAARAGYGKARASLRKTIAAIETGRVAIGIDEVKHCSGG